MAVQEHRREGMNPWEDLVTSVDLHHTLRTLTLGEARIEMLSWTCSSAKWPNLVALAPWETVQGVAARLVGGIPSTAIRFVVGVARVPRPPPSVIGAIRSVRATLACGRRDLLHPSRE